MSKQIQSRGGTTAQHKVFTGAPREVTVDTDKNVVVVHDGVTAGGVPMAKEETLNGAVEAEFTAYGYTKRVPKKDRWLETDTPNVIVDKVGDAVRFSDGLVDRLGPELVTGYGNPAPSRCSISGPLESIKMDAVGYDGYIPAITFSVANGDNVYKLFTIRTTEDAGASSYINSVMVPGLKKGYNTFLIDPSTTTTIQVYGKVGAVTVFSEVSVRELTQAELPLAPFDPLSTDELLDDKLNGVTTQIDHAKGDIVVTGNELVEPNNFILDATVTDNLDGSYTITNAGSGLQVINNIADKSKLVDKETYKVSYSITAITSGSISFNVWGSGALQEPSNAEVGDYTYIHTVDTSVTNNGLGFYTCGTATLTISNISFTKVDDTYQAITNTTAGDLLTDTNKFQTIDYVTRQDVVLVTKTGYKTVKGLHYFGDDVSNDAIASAYQMSKLGNGLYHDGTEEVVISGLVPRLG